MEASALPEKPELSAGNRQNGGEQDEEGVKGEEGDRNLGGNRWPKEETLALLKIRSEMDTVFKDSGLKAPLWEEVSRKLSELGYSRSAKKCKEKFENIYKYHRRTKEGRSGKTYRFFDQLQALDTHSYLPSSSPERINSSMVMEIDPISTVKNVAPCSIQNPSLNFMDTSTSTTSTTSKESAGTQKKKRKLTDFFERLMREVVEKQENLQKKFLDAIEKCEQDRIAREEAWKMQELDRIKRERELLVQERSIAAAKDAAVLAFLQKFSEQSTPVQLPETPVPAEKLVERQEFSNGGESFLHLGSSRWPKDEVEALIKLRTNLDGNYQENGPKGPLWEEISAAMKKLGYNRSAKRCKEKWENMNKYFKKVKESNKKRPEDAKTCPYFHQLDAIYKERTAKKVIDPVNPIYELKPEELLMHMMGSQEERQQLDLATDNNGESENVDHNQEDGDNEDENEQDDYQIVATNPSSVAIMG
ncbi:trihelix transcription factor GT-2-like [Pistacia vera]|uniref:trihelix transcription factor GT-2-like n=1 Tax=Pistacia vera TaxID=55513 RepID=UPI00126374EC|nr:trihelix transcription factor GT-2-like [Pistacia vera]XP_031273029.1 trihelix transcription factor GT-2-like [Pistacia vera]